MKREILENDLTFAFAFVISKIGSNLELDRWILSELNSLITNVDEYYNDYEPTKAARAINSFVIDNLSNWYVRLSMISWTPL